MEPSLTSSDASKSLLNLVTKLWQYLDANSALSMLFPEYIKLVQIALIHVLGLMEDERTFSLVTFCDNKLRNKLDRDHLGLVVGMHNQNMFNLMSFPYEDCFKQ